ncbi:hypothetical protein [Billgrantia bachuensis]|uniref:hypothetical protein n=1 Tax=Billgrantia bachuensis TaxID=2717286 RepID=UPI001F10AC35|nr:hypothetical protein [Halomonas bachuensis]
MKVMNDEQALRGSAVQEAMNVRHQRLKLLALIAVFALPMLTAWIMLTWRVGIPEEHTAHGELAPPVPSLPEWPLVERQASFDGGDWVLAFDCTRDCEALADRWWRMHRALGREAPRVTRLRIGGSAEALPGEEVSQWREMPEWQAAGAVWLLDPQGRVVLRYDDSVAERDVKDDLTRLLKRNPDPRAAEEFEGS